MVKPAAGRGRAGERRAAPAAATRAVEVTAAADGVRLPAGVRDFLPRATARRRAIVERMVGAFERWGYQRIITPLYECADVLERGLGDGARAQAVRFVEPSGEVVALRPDFTPQVARLVATRMADVGGPIRLCYDGAVTRIGRGARGQREILQAGVELIGAPAPAGDAEVLAVAAAALAGTGVADLRLELGHVALARWAIGEVADPARRAELLERLVRRDARGAQAAARGLPAALVRVLAALPELHGAPAAVLRRARALAAPAAVRESFDQLEAVLAAVGQGVEGAAAARPMLDLGEVRGADYYTSVRFAGYLGGAGEAVLRGGRYDQLLGRYGRPRAATGFAVDVELVAEAQRAADPTPAGRGAGLLVCATDARAGEAGRLAAALRGTGHRVALDLGAPRDRAGRLAYAAVVGLDRVVELGDRGAAALHHAGGTTALPVAALKRAAAGDVGPLALIVWRT